LLACLLSTVIAEKFEAMVSLADINSRMNDFWDVAYLLENHVIRDDELLAALNATLPPEGDAKARRTCRFCVGIHSFRCGSGTVESPSQAHPPPGPGMGQDFGNDPRSATSLL